MAKSGYITITQNSQSVANNTSNITVKGIIVTTGESYRGDQRTGTYTIKQGSKTLKSGTFTHGAPAKSTTTLFSVTLTVAHNSNGSSDTITASYNYDSGWCTGSGSLALSTIPRQATITSAPNFSDEDNPVLKYSNPAGNSATSLQACIASTDGKTIYVPYRDISKTGTSYTFSLTDSERNTLRNVCVSAKSMSVKFYVKTVIGSSTFYSSLQKTLSIINALPTLTASAEDVNSLTLALTGDKNTVVKYYSNVLVSMTAQALKGASIKSYSIVCGNKSLSASSGTINAVESGTFVFTVTDSRGNTTSKTLIKTLINYVNLTCVMKTEPPSADGNMKFDVTGNCFNGSFGLFSNQISVQYRYKSENDYAYSDWIEISPTFENDKYDAVSSIDGLDYSLQYTFQARIIDSLMEVKSGEYAIRVFPVFYYGKDKFFFNVPINILGVDQDYIVEQGNDGTWEYTKWSSGKCELFTADTQEATVSIGYGGAFCSDRLTCDLPFTVYYPRLFLGCNNDTAWASPAGNTISGSTSSVAYRIWRGEAATSTLWATSLLIKGRWKQEEVQ